MTHKPKKKEKFLPNEPPETKTGNQTNVPARAAMSDHTLVTAGLRQASVRPLRAKSSINP